MKTTINKCPVLIVDDDNDLCILLTLTINRICAVHVEHSIGAASSYLQDASRERRHDRVRNMRREGESDTASDTDLPALILLDNSLPDGLGIGFIKEIKETYPGVNVVLMTADKTEGLQEAAMREGANSFVAKPFRPGAINEVVRSFCPGL